MKKTNLWMAVVNAEDTVVFTGARSTKQKAEIAIVKYLRRNEDFDGRDFSDACFWIGENNLKLDLMVFEMDLKDFKDVKLQDGLLVEPPPKEKGLFRVVYAIDVGACNSLDAAKKTHEIMADPDSFAPVLEIIDYKGNTKKIDLSKST